MSGRSSSWTAPATCPIKLPHFSERGMLLLSTIIEQALDEIRNSANPTVAAKNKAYFRCSLKFHGVSKRLINDVAKRMQKRFTMSSPEILTIHLEKLWSSEYHEEKSLAIVLAALHSKLFNQEHIESVFKTWLEDCTSWDHVDELCIQVIGRIALQDRDILTTVFDWSHSTQMWVRRAALLVHLPSIRSANYDYTVLENTCKRLVTEKQLHIQKAIGWVIRELSQRSPEDSEQLILRICMFASNLTIREATRKLDSIRREKLISRIVSIQGSGRAAARMHA